MLAAVLLAGMYPDWVPIRWHSNDPRSLDLLDRTPINCLWLERPLWSELFAVNAGKRGIATLGVIGREGDPMEAATALTKLGFTGAVLEGDFDERTATAVGGILAKFRMSFIVCAPRKRMRLGGDAPIAATYEGLWPGVRAEAQAGPSAAPWIDTNTGFLRFVRASTDATIWMAMRPPPKLAIPMQHYLHAIGDAAMNGARWVLDFDDDFWRRLLARDPKRIEQWKEIAACLQHYEDRREWRGASPRGGIAVIEDSSTGVLVDMLAAKHLPVFAVPLSKAASPEWHGAPMAVNPDSLANPSLAAFAKSGGIVIDGPSKRDPANTGWMEEIWKKVDAVTAERNMGARLHNVSSVRWNLLAIPHQKQTILHLVNYSDYPVQGVSVRVLGSYHHARLYQPGKPAIDLDIYKSEDGAGFDIDEAVGALATIVIE